ncbi:MAK21 [Candida theae]|uniref:MAK21 n=1 Tax=Candida theae TaxID=1198502 RepID=A0AAD5BBG1_9ASCO|nr:MAK21 [Candida theae]KAI5950495.1 MAK21 [Candida theae]
MSSILNLSNLKDKITSKLSSSGSSKNQKPGKKESIQGHKDANQKSEKVNESKVKDSKKKSNKGYKGNESKAATVDKKETTKSRDTDEILRQEALALGATEEDLKLLQGIESDDEKSELEFDDDSKLDKEFGNDLSKFIKDIGLGNGEPIVVDDESVDEEEVGDGLEQDEEEGADLDEEDASVSDSSSSEDEEEEEEEDENVPELVHDGSTNDTSNDDDQVVVKQAELNNSKKGAKKDENSDEITDLSMVSSGKLAVPNRLDWYNIYPLTNAEALPKLDRFARERLLERGQKTLDKDNKAYLEEFASNSSQKKFLSQILSDGTLNDKISALTLLVQEAPLHNLKALDTLLSYCDKKSRTAALQSIAALKDLLLNGLLPDRKLFAFDKQPLSKDESLMTDAQLAVFCFEDHLKKAYFKLLQILERLLQDPIVHVRMSALNHVFDLLKSKPEQEVNLLKLGVNKLGDTDNKVSAKASYLILQLEQTHPAMKKIVTDAVIDVIFQSTTDDHSKYYGVTTLNQTIITRREDELANALVKTYFALFEKVLIESNAFTKTTNGPEKDKLMGESQRGRKNNRKNFKKGKKGGKSVKQEEKSQQEIVEEKNSKMFSALLTGLNRAFPFCNLPNEVFQNHLDTLFKITHSSNFNTAIQALVLINHIITKQELNSDRYYRTLYESLLDSRLVTTSKQGIYLNLLYKSLKNDSGNIPRVLAFVKRILQVIAHWLNVGAIAGMLFLLMELAKSMPEIGDLLIDANSRPDQEEEDEEANNKEPSAEVEGSDKTDSISVQQANIYDPKKRDPNFANADKSSLWEIDLFLNHFHPTVALYASSFIDGTPQAKPDLGLYTLAHFLDRFVYKNAKQKPQTKGSSIMQPLGGAHTGELLVRSTNVLDSSTPANTENWLNKKVGDIKADERFFHQYFTTKVNKLKKSSSKDEGEGGDDGDDLDEDRDENGMDDDEVWKALVNSRPDVEASSGDDMSDLDPEDFSDFDDDEVELSQGEDDGEDFDDGEINEFDRPLSAGNDVDEEDEDVNGDEEDEFDDEFDEDEAKMFNINDDDEFSDSEVDVKILGEGEDGASDSDEGSDDEKETEKEVFKGSRKRKNEKDDNDSTKPKKKSKRPRIKDLPLFASAEDYADKL